MINKKRISMAFALTVVWGSLAQGGEVVEAAKCLQTATSESQCKTCCDCLDSDGATRKSCRDNCAEYDFGPDSRQNPVDAPSALGEGGDYSVALDLGTEQACKEYCDGSEELACGDRHYCRDACNARFSGVTRKHPHAREHRGLPPEIVAACQGKNEQDLCRVGETFTGSCHTHQLHLACLMGQEEAPDELKEKWDSLDRNRDGFLDVNEIQGDGQQEPPRPKGKKPGGDEGHGTSSVK
jgi:hypothetical protein